MSAIQILRMWLASIVFMMYPPDRVHPGNLILQENYKRHVNEVVIDIQEVVYDRAKTPWLYGKWARAQEAALATIIAAEESGGFNLGVENGIIRRDRGASWCLMAMNIGRGRTMEGWSGPDLIADRKKCITAGVNAMRRSMSVCRANGVLSGLSAYDTGRCIKNERISVSRVSRAFYYISKKVPTDEAVLVLEATDKR